jgi:hypothetical protein
LGVQAKRDLETYTFANFVAEFRHSWTGEELEMRKQLFETELLRVKTHNAGIK